MSNRAERRARRRHGEEDRNIVLICMRADAPFMVAGATLNHICTRCGQPVMLAPSGQRYLAQHAGRNVLLVCLLCFEPDGRDREGMKNFTTVANLDVLRQELANVTINHRGARN